MPLHFMQASMNTSILALLDREAQSPPAVDVTKLRVQNVMVDPGKAIYGVRTELLPMTSVRAMTISVSEPEQLNRVKHKYTCGRNSMQIRMSTTAARGSFMRDVNSGSTPGSRST